MKKRLEPIKYDVLRVTGEEGRSAGMRFAGVKDWVRWIKWLESETGNPSFGLSPTKLRRVLPEPDPVSHQCPPHHWRIGSDNIGRCIYCDEVRDFSDLPQRAGQELARAIL